LDWFAKINIVRNMDDQGEANPSIPSTSKMESKADVFESPQVKRPVRVSFVLSQIVRIMLDGHEEGVNEITRFIGPLAANIATPFGMR
jgi:hypothetical protein